jgi:hypothetical protein
MRISVTRIHPELDRDDQKKNVLLDSSGDRKKEGGTMALRRNRTIN